MDAGEGFAITQEERAVLECRDIDTLFSRENMDNHFMRRIIEKILVDEEGNVTVYLKS